MKNIKFIGQITTVSPVVVTLPNQTGMPQNTHGAYYIPASSLRGMLRSTATHAICSILKSHDIELPVDVIYMLSSGVDTGRKLKLGGGYETLGKNKPIRVANPQVSTFGNFATAGKLKMGNAICDANVNPISRYGNGSRNHPFNRNPDLFNFVKAQDVDYLKGIMEADALSALETADLKDQKAKLKSQLKTADSVEKKAIFNQIDEIEEEIKGSKKLRVGSSETILFPLEGFEAIDPGYNLDHRFTLTNPSEIELQYMLWVLYIASFNFRIGGHQNIGCGEIHGKWDIIESSFEHPEPIKIGSLTIDDDGFQLTGIEFNPNKIEFDPKQIVDAIINGTFDFTVY